MIQGAVKKEHQLLQLWNLVKTRYTIQGSSGPAFVARDRDSAHAGPVNKTGPGLNYLAHLDSIYSFEKWESFEYWEKVFEKTMIAMYERKWRWLQNHDNDQSSLFSPNMYLHL